VVTASPGVDDVRMATYAGIGPDPGLSLRAVAEDVVAPDGVLRRRRGLVTGRLFFAGAAGDPVESGGSAKPKGNPFCHASDSVLRVGRQVRLAAGAAVAGLFYLAATGRMKKHLKFKI